MRVSFLRQRSFGCFLERIELFGLLSFVSYFVRTFGCDNGLSDICFLPVVIVSLKNKLRRAGVVLQVNLLYRKKQFFVRAFFTVGIFIRRHYILKDEKNLVLLIQ